MGGAWEPFLLPDNPRHAVSSPEHVHFAPLWLYTDTGERQDVRDKKTGSGITQCAWIQPVSSRDDRVGGSLSLPLEFRTTLPGLHPSLWCSAVLSLGKLPDLTLSSLWEHGTWHHLHLPCRDWSLQYEVLARGSWARVVFLHPYQDCGYLCGPGFFFGA